ncbi:MAG: class I SAM-dependent RNA methyltransferase [Gemmatimonadota bacterium]
MDAMKQEAPVSGALAEVEIHGMSSQGSGVGRLEDGRTVFVPRTAPGERVRIRLGRVKPRWAEASLVEVLSASPDRRAPLCTKYDECGGCQLQHLPESVQRAWKGRIVTEALDRIGGLGRFEAPEVVGSPKAVGYRNRMSFTLRRVRGGRMIAGLHALDRPAHVIEIRDECVLPEQAIQRAWKALRRAWGPGARALPDGGRLRLTLRHDGGGDVTLVVAGGAEGWSPAGLLESVSELSAVVHRPDGAETTATATDEGSDMAATGFEQVNTEAAALLRAYVVEQSADAPRVVDAYCGTGPYGRALAERGATVVGIELDAEAAAVALRDAPESFTVRTGSVEAQLSDALPTDLLIVNPPRSGLAVEVRQAVLGEPPARLVYVSCDPATLARDLGILSERYEVSRLECFDLFPQTAHVETVVTMNLRGGE